MGNINNPCINRWGVNSFWSHYWYSDNRYHQFLQQDTMFSTFLKIYIHYGCDTPPKFFQDKLWYKKTFDDTKMKLYRDNRWFHVIEAELNYDYYYIIRNEHTETFESRWVILRYNKWFVVSISWFQPDKTLNKRKKLTRTMKHILTSHPTTTLSDKKTRTLSRFSSILKTRCCSSLEGNNAYVF